VCCSLSLVCACSAHCVQCALYAYTALLVLCPLRSVLSTVQLRARSLHCALQRPTRPNLTGPVLQICHVCAPNTLAPLPPSAALAQCRRQVTNGRPQRRPTRTNWTPLDSSKLRSPRITVNSLLSRFSTQSSAGRGKKSKGRPPTDSQPLGNWRPENIKLARRTQSGPLTWSRKAAKEQKGLRAKGLLASSLSVSNWPLPFGRKAAVSSATFAA